jgi:hypothetical protein
VTEELLYRLRKEQAGRVQAAGAEGESSVTRKQVAMRDADARVPVGSGTTSRPLD